MPRVLEIAVRRSIPERGVSVVVIPGDVLLKPALAAPAPKLAGLAPADPVITPSDASLGKLAEFIDLAERATLLLRQRLRGRARRIDPICRKQ
jgi:pyruvate dehydrogenase (quinone)